MTKNLSLTDHTALAFLAQTSSGRAATHWVAKACGFGLTSIARTMLRRLARWGLVEGVTPIGGGNIYWWRITDQGRRAVQP
ncbi:hypothetical protein [Sphingobium sp. WCS2017Hpa-17]|uniref:hypothetical protein n=1 Tax=Sphingobium sp. WCS2017Hpa-17 TaxID=3073638 RepID=UPI0028899963|nr:hypothetical protein [Sphingobium sp. WCS2017Hpa-17]